METKKIKMKTKKSQKGTPEWCLERRDSWYELKLRWLAETLWELKEDAEKCQKWFDMYYEGGRYYVNQIKELVMLRDEMLELLQIEETTQCDEMRLLNIQFLINIKLKYVLTTIDDLLFWAPEEDEVAHFQILEMRETADCATRFAKSRKLEAALEKTLNFKPLNMNY